MRPSAPQPPREQQGPPQAQDQEKVGNMWTHWDQSFEAKAFFIDKKCTIRLFGLYTCP